MDGKPEKQVSTATWGWNGAICAKAQVIVGNMSVKLSYRTLAP